MRVYWRATVCGLLNLQSGRRAKRADRNRPDETQRSVEQAAADGLLPLSALRYVERNRAPLVLDEALRDHRFADDPCFSGMVTGVMLHVPILNQGVLPAVLLENRKRRGTFAADRLEAVQLMAGKLAVSLDNSMLYAPIERKVDERTQALELANRELAALSITVELTGLADRRHFDAALEKEWMRVQRPRTAVSAAMIDIHQFKLYNDDDGHPAGDHCLKIVADALANLIRSGAEVVVRCGGEEFALIQPGAPGRNARRRHGGDGFAACNIDPRDRDNWHRHRIAAGA
ncbi:MAG: diguanylate cyclase [Pseudomonadota bacterium]